MQQLKVMHLKDASSTPLLALLSKRVVVKAANKDQMHNTPTYRQPHTTV
jgi:hypothetical protein